MTEIQPSTAAGFRVERRTPPERLDVLSREILKLKDDLNAVILAHNYQVPEIQDLADYVGDSLGLARQAAETDAAVIVFCGVHFMAETAKLLNPGKRLIIPDLGAGCSLSDSVTPHDVRLLKEKYPGVPVVTYVNTSAGVKAEADVCCTSGTVSYTHLTLPTNREV